MRTCMRLVVEDEDAIRIPVTRALTRWGHQMEAVEGIEKAREVAHRSSPKTSSVTSSCLMAAG